MNHQNIAYLAFAILIASPVIAQHDHADIRLGLQDEDVIENDLRLRGIDPRGIRMRGSSATVDATVNGRAFILRIDRITGTAVRTDGGSLPQVLVPPGLDPSTFDRLVPIDR